MLGSSSYTYPEAARRLGVSTRTVHNYIKKGLLKKYVFAGKAVVDRQEIEELAGDKDREAPTLTRASFTDLVARVKSLENSMSLVKKVMDLHNDPIRPTSVDEARGLYAAANNSLSAGQWTVEEAGMWSELLGRVDELTLNSIGSAVAVPDPWIPFYKVGNLMQEFMGREFAKNPSVAKERIITQLEVARKTLRAVVVAWVESGRGSTDGAILRAMGGSRENLLKKALSRG